MTLARDAIHKALITRIAALVSLPVRVAPTGQLPYVRLGEDTEASGEANKQGEASVVRPMISVFSTKAKEAREAVTTIGNDLLSGAALDVTGFRVVDLRLDTPGIIPVPEYSPESTVFGERLMLIITTEPTP